MGEFQPNAARYREASQPHESIEAANKALEAFYADLGVLRLKYKIADAYVVLRINLIEEDGQETSAGSATGYGNKSQWALMLASAFGVEKEKLESTLRKAIRSGGK